MASQALAVVRQDSALATAEQWTREDINLIKSTCFPDAADNELKMFLHVAAKSGLDPLRKQIHAIRLNGRLSFVADINGLQARAAREPDFRGLPCAVIYEGDDFLWDALEGKPVKHHSTLKGKPVGAWAVVEREGMKPFASLVRFDEYNNPRNGLWREKPSVMILKAAKSTALRLAYPEQLGNIYERAELDKAQHEGVSEDAKPVEANFSPEAVKLANAATKPAGKREEPTDAEVVPATPAPARQLSETEAAMVAHFGAPMPTAPAQAATPPERPAATPAQLRARATRVWNAMKAGGATAEGFRAWAADILKRDVKSTEWTEAEVQRLEDEVQKAAGG